MNTTKPAAVAKSTKPATPGYRIIMRGNLNGKRLRAVRTVHANSFEAAAGYLAENGDKLAKGLKFKPDTCHVAAPISFMV